ncbi:YheC/YheD family protein [Lederbergia citrea]|uniref:YheC/YheD family protein n=1 Tax=Lederbergia citrea TaxID=2833581 RepID=A0A942Z295_9BACI|nr:YheC/YheD family protein [Lederbergia citrea]MBS4204196.1 YheC/YheD family protein [Lederbergia citrea]MBS4221219.1 YheC/YheD family protein [Lederbergia citrea]
MAEYFNLEVFDSPDLQFFYPREYEVEVPPEKIAFGSSWTEVTGARQPNGRNVISVSSRLAKKLNLPKEISSLCLFSNDETIYLGPLVGIFSSGFTPFQISPIGERSTLFAKLLSVQSDVGAVSFLFGEQHIDWEHGLINGYFYFDKGWERRKVPFPNVVYDRLPYSQSETMEKAIIVKSKLEKDYLIPWYNPGFFNQLELFERLYNDAQTDTYLPETLSFTSFSEMERMLAEYGHVFLKNPQDRTERRVVQIIYDKIESIYYCRIYEGKARLLKFETLERLMSKVFKGQSLEKLIVQQGIRLIRREKQPIDFRVQVNKNETGKWQVSAMAAKKRKGSASDRNHNFILMLSDVFPDQKELELFKEKLEIAALALAEGIEKNLGGTFGEIGFELGIDYEGKVWMLEADSKPSRFIFSHPGLQTEDMLTRKLPLSFAIYMTQKTL